MRVLSLLLCLLILGGCSGAVRLQRFEIAASTGWQANEKRQSYQCDQANITVRTIRTSRIIIMGPIIPLIPVRHENSGDFEIWLNGSNTCPVILQQDKVLQALSGAPGKSACLYDKSELNLTEPLKVRVGNDATASQCTTNPIQYEEHTDWKYCFMCTA